MPGAEFGRGRVESGPGRGGQGRGDPRRAGPAPRPADRAAAARTLVGVSPLAARWIERLLAGHSPPLTPPQYLALRGISAEPISVNELALRAGVSGSAASQLLTVLVDSGLVERQVSRADRRRQELVLTAAGDALLSSVDALLTERFEELIEALPAPEVDALARGLPHVYAALSGAAPPRRPPPPRPRGPDPRPADGSAPGHSGDGRGREGDNNT